ncbi:MAG: tRNA (guanosine(37)-N1)-methyltransferase TrmD, partial [Lentisphaeria bacterium]|nr:tRNA (guanosine(37)-N1)-methyltransferase TrmD [Lentisphaeria bacterium]
MHIDVLTLFPELFPGPLGASVVGRAAERELATVGTVDVRDFAADKRGTVDEKPYGGGPGMLMMAEPLTLALESVRRPDSVVVMTTPRGERFDQKLARELAACSH